MSTIYKYQDSETALTVPPNPSDALVVYSTVASGTRQVSAALQAQAAVTVTAATSATTGTNLTAYGISTITSSNNALGYLLDPPLYAGFRKTIVVLSTGGPVVTTSGAVVVTAASTTTTTLTFNGNKGSRIELAALSTASWLHVSTTTTAHVALS